MAALRKLLAGLVIAALTQFSAISPVHAHNDHAASEIVHAVAMDVHHADGHHHDHDDSNTPDREDDHFTPGSSIHAHAVPQFMSADADVYAYVPSAWAFVDAPVLNAGVVLRPPSPPLRPPRAFL